MRHPFELDDDLPAQWPDETSSVEYPDTPRLARLAVIGAVLEDVYGGRDQSLEAEAVDDALADRGWKVVPS